MQTLGAIARRHGPEGWLLHNGVVSVRGGDRLQIVEIGGAVVALVVLVVGILRVAVDQRLLERIGHRRKRPGPILIATHDQTGPERSEEHTSELQSLMRISYAVFCLKKK